MAFLNNHREVIAALDFFTVSTLTFRLLYCLFVMEHGRRRILHFNTTVHPTSDWIVQQLREAFPLPSPYRYVVLDRDAKFNPEVWHVGSKWNRNRSKRVLEVLGTTEQRNWVGSCRREMLDQSFR